MRSVNTLFDPPGLHSVIPAEAGIQERRCRMDSRYSGNSPNTFGTPGVPDLSGHFRRLWCPTGHGYLRGNDDPRGKGIGDFDKALAVRQQNLAPEARRGYNPNTAFPKATSSIWWGEVACGS